MTKLARVAMHKPFVRQTVRLGRRDRGRPAACTRGTTCSRPSRACIGVKTGHTNGAGWSQVAAARGARRDDLRDAARRRDARGPERRPRGAAHLGPLALPDRRGRSTAARTYGTVRTAYGQPAVRVVAAKPALRVVRVERPLVERVVAARSRRRCPSARGSGSARCRCSTAAPSSRARRSSPRTPSRGPGRSGA